MTRRLPTGAKLALEAGVDFGSANRALFEVGLDLYSPTQTVWSRHLRQARLALGLPPITTRPDLLRVDSLALRAGLPEPEVRQRLVEARILAKKRLRRVPRHLLAKAEEILGIG